MQLQRLNLLNFRNYKSRVFSFSGGIHVIYGKNGAGKTSILEAIYYLALTKSFRATKDKYLIFDQETICRVEGEFLTGQGQTTRVALAYSQEAGKQLTVNGQKVPKFAEYIGDIPVVLLYPADLELSQGSPQQRRRFLDVLLCQSSKLYLHSLIQYNRSLRQRNQLLQSGRFDVPLILSWEENLITHGAELIRRREAVAAELSRLVQNYYQTLSQRDDATKVVYRCNIPTGPGVDLTAAYRQAFAEKRSQEREYGTTLVGPHRDDLLFLLNGKPMKTHASQGEHKTFVISLKLAEFHHLEQQQQQAPILLFDDIFGELDADRIRQMLEQLSRIGQVFVTTTSRSFFDKVQNFKAPVSYYPVENGTPPGAEV